MTAHHAQPDDPGAAEAGAGPTAHPADGVAAAVGDWLSSDAGLGPDGAAAPSGAPEGGESPPLDVETLVVTLEEVTSERDSYLADLQRVTAEFANFRRQATKRQSDTIAHAASGLVEKLLPILDACDAALQQGATDVQPIQAALVDSLRKEGLEVMGEAGAPFDPERHEAVAHDTGDGAGEPTVAEIMRTGYALNGRVLRPAMVRVQG